MLNYSANGPSGYNLTNSLRFRSSASAYLNRTPASAGNRQKFTFSFWLKRGTLSVAQELYFVNAGGGTFSQFSFTAGNAITFASVTSSVADIDLTTIAVFRDPSAWYHIVLAVDTTQATNTNRVLMYVNGVLQTLSGTYSIQNYNCQLNNTISQNIGRPSTGTFDGYLAEYNFIDGQALTPSSFGSTNPVTGVWQPKQYTGTYGTNGFYLKFSDIATTSGSNAGLGKDFSGNGNYWTTNNISVTAGTTYDAMSDVPTLTSATVGNYATMNPLNRNSSSFPIVDSANLNISSLSNQGGSAATNSISSTMAVNSGKWYCEITYSTSNASGSFAVGITKTTNNITSNLYSGVGSGNSYLYYGYNGQKYNGSSGSAYGSSLSTNDVAGIAFDLDNGTITFYKNGVSQGTAYTWTPDGSFWYIVLSGDSSLASAAGSVNFGQRPFAYTPPTGYNRLNTFNLPTSTIVKGNTVMDATLWTGNGSAGTITNAGGFRPDFVWWKNRNSTRNHLLFDSVRGATKFIQSNSSNAEQTDAQSLTSFNSNGFSYGTSGNGSTNGETYVGWQWQAGSSTVTNTSGSISSQVRANTTTGFSIVTYTGNGIGGATVGHGLGVAPKFIIAKTINNADNWPVGTSALGWNQHLLLNNTNATAITSSTWSDTAPTSTVFTIGTDNRINANTWTYVAYCWAEIAGFSSFGSYIGNGSSDGTFIYLGFRPKFVLWKRTSLESWIMTDTSRSPSNIVDKILYPFSNVAEITSNRIDILSNGFKIRTTDSDTNGSGATYIYMAFAENPFKNSLAR